MATVPFFDHVLTDRITDQARKVQFWRTVLTVLAGLLFGLGWATCKAFAGLWFAAVWAGTAFRVGWQEARKPSSRT